MLKYLFRVTYKDNTTFEQTQEDISSKDPQKSAYFDIDQDNIWYFELVDQETGDTFFVDLPTGAFGHNDRAFFMHDRTGEEGNLKDFRLIYFRRVTKDFNINMQEVGQHIAYHMGWQCTIDGKNYKRIMELN